MLHSRSAFVAMTVSIALMLGAGTTYLVLQHGIETDDEPRACSAPCFKAPKTALVPTAQSGPPTSAPSRDGLERVLRTYLNRPELGELAATVVYQRTGEVGWQHRGEAAMVPASVNKLVTAVAVLAERGPAYRIPTKVLAGNAPGEVVLVGGGDVTLAAGGDGYYPGAARLDDLARQLKRKYPQPITKVIVDSSRYTGPATGQGWDDDVASGGYGAPVTPLALDGARRAPSTERRSDSPDLDVGRAFADQLSESNSPVQVELVRDGDGSLFGSAGQTEPLAAVNSPPVSRLVEIMLSNSDNVVAESLARQVALARGEPASFSGAASATRQTLLELGLDLEGTLLVDGSGLSRNNRLSTTLLARLLHLAAQPALPQLRPALGGLPVAGFTGTLHDRFDRRGSRDARSVVRAKTGSLSQVTSLAGTIVTSDGAVLAFAVIANGFTKNGGETAEHTLDELAATLAACGCP